MQPKECTSSISHQGSHQKARDLRNGARDVKSHLQGGRVPLPLHKMAANDVTNHRAPMCHTVCHDRCQQSPWLCHNLCTLCMHYVCTMLFTAVRAAADNNGQHSPKARQLVRLGKWDKIPLKRLCIGLHCDLAPPLLSPSEQPYNCFIAWWWMVGLIMVAIHYSRAYNLILKI